MRAAGALSAPFSPTPIHKLPSFSAENDIYIKREDLLPFMFGGNKVRLALLFLEDMERRGKNCIIVYGSARSNLVRAVAGACSSAGVPCCAVISSDGQSPNLSMAKACGATIVRCGKDGVRAAVEFAFEFLRAEGLDPYYVYGDSTGAGNESVPAAAYATTYGEICSQEEGMGERFDLIFLPSGTGMTQSGLIAGSIIHGDDPSRIVGISVARDRAVGEAHIRTYVESYLQSIGSLFSDDFPVRFLDCYRSGGYGSAERWQEDVMERLLVEEGVPSDATYVGKGFSGMLRYLSEVGAEGERVLFLHTGGTPLFFDDFEKGSGC